MRPWITVQIQGRSRFASSDEGIVGLKVPFTALGQCPLLARLGLGKPTAQATPRMTWMTSHLPERQGEQVERASRGGRAEQAEQAWLDAPVLLVVPCRRPALSGSKRRDVPIGP